MADKAPFGTAEPGYDTHMLGIDVRAARVAWTVLLVALAAVLLYLIRRTLLIFVAALLLAYLLAPLVGLVDRITPKKFPRVLSLAVVYVLLLALVGFAGFAIGNRVLLEARQLSDVVPQWLQSSDPLTSLPVPPWLEPWKAKAVEAIRAELTANARQMVPLLGQVGQGILAFLGNIGFVVLVPILSFFFLKDGTVVRDRLLQQFAGTSRLETMQGILADMHLLLGQFIRALVILAVATLVVYDLFLAAVGVPYAALLAVLAGSLEFIPMVGPLSAGVVICLVALFSGKASLVVWIIVFLLAYRLFQDYVLQPFLMSKGVELHPLWVIFGVLAGEQVGGVAGMFLSIPVLATLRVVSVRILKARRQVRSA